MAKLKEFSLQMIDKSRDIAVEKLDITPLFIPVGYTRPETLNDALSRILSTSAGQGLTLDQAFNTLRGEFDDLPDDSFDDAFPLMDDDDDGFEQSPFATYEQLEVVDQPKPAPSASAPVPTEPSVAQQNAEAKAQEDGAESH